MKQTGCMSVKKYLCVVASMLLFAGMNSVAGEIKSTAPVIAVESVAGGLYPPEEFERREEAGFAEGEVIVKLGAQAAIPAQQAGSLPIRSMEPVFKHRAGPQALAGPAGEGVDTEQPQGLERVFLVRFEEGFDVEQKLEIIKQALQAEYVQLNYIYHPDTAPNDPYYDLQYGHKNAGAEFAWDVTTGSEDVVVAVIGTGVDIDHPDLAANIWSNPREVTGNSLDDDGNGFVDDVNGWNFYNNNNNPRPAGDSHETSVAGVVAAEGDNGEGVCGVSWHSAIMPLRIAYTSAQVAAAVEYARANGARIINMSFGNYDKGKYGDTVVKDAIDAAYADGVLLIATAGNDTTDTKRYPAALNNVMAVGATNRFERRVSWSNFGPWVDIAAPGDRIYTTIPGVSLESSGTYDYASGTSFAAPYVAGAAALMFSDNPALTNVQARARLENTADPVDPAVEYISIGSGRVSASSCMADTGADYPLGEIVEPENRISFAEEATQIPVSFFGHGDSYTLEYSAYERDDWIMVGQGSVDGDAAGDGLVYLAFDNPGPGTYMLRLTVDMDGRTHADKKMFAVDGPYQQDWPGPVLGYQRWMMSTALCMDIDEDGRNEIIQSSYGGNTAGGYTYIWNEDGSSLSGWPRALMGDPSCSTSAIGDVDGDGDYEVVTTTYRYAAIYVWHWQGAQLLPGWPKQYGSRSIIRANPVLADLDGDGDSEIIVAVCNYDDVNEGIFAFQHDGTQLWHFAINNVQGPLAAADLDGDGDIEIVASAWQNLYVLDHEGNEVRRFDGGSHKSAIVADLDMDGVPEIIYYDMWDYQVRAVHVTGEVLWEAPTNAGAYGALSAGDLTGNGYPEVFMAVNSGTSDYYAELQAWDYQGNPLSELGFPKHCIAGFMQSAPAVGDINGDGNNELVVGSKFGLVFAWDSSGDHVEGFPKTLADGVSTTATLADLDLDGDIEIMLGQEDSIFHVWDLPGPYDTDAIDWGMYRHDPQNSGLLKRVPKLEPVAIPSTIMVGETLRFALSASNSDSMPLYYYVRRMPPNASFDSRTAEFSWSPGAEEAGKAYRMYLFLTDGIRQDHIPVTVNVEACQDSRDCTSDGLFCSGDPVCTDGVCGFSGNPCGAASTPLCDEDNDRCAECLDDGDCADTEMCRDAVCMPGCELSVRYKKIRSRKLTRPRRVVLHITGSENFDMFGAINLGPLQWQRVSFNKRKNRLKVRAVVPAGLSPQIIPIRVGDCFGEIAISGNEEE